MNPQSRPPKLPGRPLNKTDLKKLALEYIDEATAEAARLRRVNSSEGAEITCQRDTGNYAGIIIPYYWPGAATSTSIRLRRDTPDIEETQPGQIKELRKYLTAPGTRNALYFPPIDPEELTSGTPLVITEGEKKTLALWRLSTHTSRAPRFIPIGLSGVWNWRGLIGKTSDAQGNRQDEKGPIPDWGRLTLKDRPITILFDRDASTNPKVRYARYQLAQFLAKQGARPSIAEIPPDSQHKGIDDLTAAEGPKAALAIIASGQPADVAAELAAIIRHAPQVTDAELCDIIGRLLSPLSNLDYAAHRITVKKALSARVSVADLDRVVKARRDEWEKKKNAPREAQTLKYKGEVYEATPQGLVLWRSPRQGEGFSPVYLCNFTARIIADVIRDDGDEQTRALKLAASVGDQAAEVVITPADFARMDWPIENLGAAANVYPNFRDHARCAIQTISRDIETLTSYTHIGWNQDGGRPIYLHAGGAISANGHIPNLHIDLDKRMSRYKLPEPPINGQRRAAIRSALEMLNVAPDTLTVPLFGAAIRAAIGNVRCSVFMTGQTGSGKSELAALAQQFYGAGMNAAALPASWDSTPNALEALAHKAKDALLVIDDFVPKGSAADLARLHQTADRILRAQGNASGRARMNADTSLRAPKVPRGMIIATGEDLPKGHSLRARLVVLEVHPGDMNWPVLTKCQRTAAAGSYAAALAAYIQHIAATLELTRQRIEEITAAMRETLSAAGHKRTPDNIASLSAAFISFTDFARSLEAITPAEHEGLLDRCSAALSAIMNSQEKSQEHGEPCAAFLESLTSAFAAGAAHLADATGGAERLDSPSTWGWRRDAADMQIWRPLGTRIGWQEGDDVFIDPIAAYKVAQAQGTGSDSLQLSLSTLKRRLKQREMLQSTDEARETVTVRRVLDGSRREVLHFHATPSLLLENNPTIPTSGENRTRAAIGTPQMSGFECRVFSAFYQSRTQPDQPIDSRMNGLASNVGNVGLFVEGRGPSSGNGKEPKKTDVGFPKTAPKTRHEKPDISAPAGKGRKEIVI